MIDDAEMDPKDEEEVDDEEEEIDDEGDEDFDDDEFEDDEAEDLDDGEDDDFDDEVEDEDEEDEDEEAIDIGGVLLFACQPGDEIYSPQPSDGRQSVGVCPAVSFQELIPGGAQMPEGIIKRLTDRGFGFIDIGKAKDLFFHSKDVQGVSFEQLHEGQKVSFTEGQGPKGPCAQNVKPV